MAYDRSQMGTTVHGETLPPTELATCLIPLAFEARIVLRPWPH